MQQSQTTKDLQSIIFKYCDARRGNNVFHDTMLELVSYLVDRRGINELHNYIYDIHLSLGEEYKYRYGILSQDEEDFLSNHYRDVLEIVCTPSENSTILRAEALQPKEITEYVASFFRSEIRNKDNNSGNYNCSGILYNPFFGYGSYPLALPEFQFIGEELNPQTWAIAVARLHANRLTDSLPALGDSMQLCPTMKCDGIITTPPFGMLGNLATEHLIEKYYELLNDNGILVMVVPVGFLTSTKKSAKEVRRKLILDKAISNITLFPSGVFYGTSIATAMVVISKNPNQTVTFTDASNAFEEKQNVAKKRIFSRELLEKQIASQTDDEHILTSVNYEQVIESLSIYPPVYLESNQCFESKSIEDLCVIYSPRKLSNGANNSLYFSPANLSSDFSRTPINPESLERKDIKPGTYHYVDFPAVLFDYNPKTNVTRVAFTGPDIQEGFIVSQNVSVLRIKDNLISDKYLMLMLSDKRVKRQLKYIMLGDFIPRLNPCDIATIQIPILSSEEEDKLVIDALNASMTEAEREAKNALLKYKKEVRIRKHALSQTISSLSALWNTIEIFRKSNGTISGTDMVGRANPTSVDEICKKISELMNTIISQTENIADVEFNWGKPQIIDFPTYIPGIARRYETPSYSILFGGSYNSIFSDEEKLQNEDNICTETGIRCIERHKDCIEFPEKALERIIVDIVSNAISYGFTDKNRKDYKIFYNWFEEDGNIVLAISNNGTPLKSDANADMVLSYGYSTNLNESGHSGIGGHEIASIMEQFGGEAEFISTPDAEFTVTYKLTFAKCDELISCETD